MRREIPQSRYREKKKCTMGGTRACSRYCLSCFFLFVYALCANLPPRFLSKASSTRLATLPCRGRQLLVNPMKSRALPDVLFRLITKTAEVRSWPHKSCRPPSLAEKSLHTQKVTTKRQRQKAVTEPQMGNVCGVTLGGKNLGPQKAASATPGAQHSRQMAGQTRSYDAPILASLLSAAMLALNTTTETPRRMKVPK